MLNREDMLRALELLPVWQLRQPAQPADPVVAVEPPVADDSVEVSSDEQGEVQALQSRLLLSADNQWAFLLPEQHSAEAEVLLQNMLKAVSASIGQDVMNPSLSQLQAYAPKIMVAMGETQAQVLLNEHTVLDALRGKVHHYEQVPVVATYTPQHLLAHPQDKANAWEDLCLAKFTIASL